MNTATGAEPLLTLAKSRDPTDREQLLSRLVQICETQEAARAPRAKLEIEAVFMALVADAERDIRARLAERLARADWAPAMLIDMLARDDIEVARPVIAASPLLDDTALIALLNEATSAHRIDVAQRPQLLGAGCRSASDRPGRAGGAHRARRQPDRRHHPPLHGAGSSGSRPATSRRWASRWPSIRG